MLILRFADRDKTGTILQTETNEKVKYYKYNGRNNNWNMNSNYEFKILIFHALHSSYLGQKTSPNAISFISVQSIGCEKSGEV